MWHVLGKKLKYLLIALLAGIFIYLDYKGVTKQSLGNWGYASAIVGTMFLVVLGLGKTNFWWRFFWSNPVVPGFIRRYLNGLCPDLNGEWQGTMRSNFKLSEPGGELDPPIDCNVKIEANWFGIQMWVETNILKSSTQFAQIEYNTGENAFVLSYLYVAKVGRPQPGDQGIHHGTGRLVVKWEDEQPILTGHYWTDRCWFGCPHPENPEMVIKNTAGQIELQRTGL